MKRKVVHPSPSERELRGPKYWRSLDELASAPGFQAQLEREFPEGAATLDGVQRHRASFLMLVPTMCVALLEHPDIKRYDLSSLVAVLAGGAPAPARMWQDLKTRLGLE